MVLLPPHMFGHVTIAQRHIYAAARNSKTLQLLFRPLLRLARCSGVRSLVVLCTLFTIAEYFFTTFYFVVLSWVWKPAFPLSWRLVLLSLFVVPTFSFLHLLQLSVHHLLLAYRWWRHRHRSSSSSPSEDYFMLPRSDRSASEERAWSDPGDDRGSGWTDFERGSYAGSPRPTQLQHRSSCHRFELAWHIVFWFVILCSSLWIGVHYQHPGDVRYLPLIEKANAHPRRAGYANQEKIFIAAMFSNNAHVIPYWSDSIVKAIHYLGADNVFVSILESGSDDQSPALLEKLSDRLTAMHVANRILVRDDAIARPDDMSGNNRIDFLSALRNRALEPLLVNGGYDRVLFSNDIYIEPETIVELLKTADGEYDVACGLDFGHFGAYDMWVLRDKLGRLTSGIWPYFFDMEDYEAMKTESPVPVFTCWNGIIVFNADPVLPIHLRSNRTLSNEPLPFELPSTHPAAHDTSLIGPSPALTPPIRFRASAARECFSSESFLLPYDFRRVFNLQRIFANPRVIVGYDWRFYVYFKWWMRHPVVKWWIEKVYDGAWMQKAVMVVGDVDRVSEWDGVDCHPWW